MTHNTNADLMRCPHDCFHLVGIADTGTTAMQQSCRCLSGPEDYTGSPFTLWWQQPCLGKGHNVQNLFFVSITISDVVCSF